jgi:CRISPR/Cas system-associated exonuclease Cas4 (RecB family)
MNKIDKIVFREINRISPSQFFSMKNCAYKSLLAEAFEKKPLLPVSPNAYFGTVLHKMLELIAKGIIKNEADFNKLFDEQVKLQEENLQQSHFDFFIPLQKNVKDFGMKKILLKKHLRIATEEPARANGVRYHSEKWFGSKDNLIGGKIDLVIEEESGTEIIDFKTGEITQDVLDEEGELFSEIKTEYKEQLKLYGYLYFETTGKYPTRMSLVNLTKQKFKVDFTHLECSALFDEAKELLKTTNESISKEEFAANPSEANCKYCLYRPACMFFLRQLETDYSFNDVSGLVKNVVKYQNGNISLFLENGKRKITVTSFVSRKYNELNEYKGKQIRVFNLRKEASEFVYSATKTTIIYE